MVFVVTAVSLIPRSARAPWDMLAGPPGRFTGWEHSWAPGALHKPQQNIPLREQRQLLIACPPQTNPSPVLHGVHLLPGDCFAKLLLTGLWVPFA